jgi:acetyl-CoA C-acetyltransferase
MTKHVFGVYSTEPGAQSESREAVVQAELDAAPKRTIRDTFEGDATVAAYSVVHGRDGAPEWGLAVCDVTGGDRAYAKILDADLLASAEEEELVGRTLRLTTTDGNVNVATT